MRTSIKFPLGAGVLLLGSVGMLVLDATERAAGQAADVLPRVERAAHKAYSETIPGSMVKFDMLPIPGGTYLMGSPASEPGRAADEGPQHPVTIRPLWMGKCEVTWDEFDLYRKEAGVGTPAENEQRVQAKADAITGPTPPYADETFGRGRDAYPVICITHHAAMEYCRWLSTKTGKIYRLPTEAEWEWACRAGTKTPYYFGNSAKELGDHAWFAANSEETTQNIGKKKPNPWGLHDILGNMAEWCLDQYDKDYYGKFPAGKPALSPVLLPSANRFSNVARGGSWADKPERLRSAARRGSDKTWIKQDPQRPQSIWWLTDAEFVGFRVVRPIEEQDNLKGLRSQVTRDSN